ncbi:MAG TPA: glycosyltransferase family 2 protein [Candidatus Hydrogenedentes bacterium]|nr:glycosyltransferase family 2 protein [Candidatus Hydrogenedentota bacterium]HNT86576.1 glycosyltransferase family 2 protein [Candidatus Hydrogenedentota bacterium]
MTREVDITVALITHNRAETLPTCLQHLEVQDYPPARFEILVLDKASTDGTAAMLARYAAGAPVRTRCIPLSKETTWPVARNQAFNEAAGRWVLFLDQDLLASPRLVSRHARAHEQQETPAAFIGHILFHPQAHPMTLTRGFLPEEYAPLPEGAPLPYLDWRAHNFSIARETALQVGGFAPDFLFPHFQAADLAWRLRERGVNGYYLGQAHAYIWRPLSIEAARARAYAMGYSLHLLVRKTGEETILQRYRLARTPLRRLYDRLTMPHITRMCEQLDVNTRPFAFYLRRVLRYEMYSGYVDALQGRPPRETGERTTSHTE